MRSKVKVIQLYMLAAVLAISAAASGWSSTASAAPTADFRQLNASQIVAEMGAGWNLGNQLEASVNGIPSETAWNNPTITPALIQAVKAAGFKTIRIPVSYLNLIGSAPNYTINAAWLNRIKTVVDYAHNEGLYVIINIHGDGFNSVNGAWLLVNSSNQATIRAKYQKVWEQIANTFANYDERLIFESMNEVFDGNYNSPNLSYYSNLNAYNQIFVDTVRQTGSNNSARWLLVPGWNTTIDYTVGNYGFVMPTDSYRSSTIPSSEKRIMISVHYYSPWDYAGEESGTITQWGATATNPSKKSTWGQEDYMESQLKSVYDKFVVQGYPAVIGEFGSIDKSNFDATNNTYRAIYAKALTATSKKYGSVPVYWDNGYNGQFGFGLFDRYTNTITQQGIINAIMSGMGGSTTNNSTLTPTTSAFDKKTANQADIQVTMTLNGNTLSSIKNGTATLVPGTDYTVAGSTLTIKKAYLAARPVGTTTLTFNFSAGSAATLAISVIDSTSSGSGTIKVQMFNGNTTAVTSTLNPRIKIVNTGTTAIPLSSIKTRYYYTIDGELPQSFFCDWSSAGCANITNTFTKLPTAQTGADYYSELAFTSGAGSLGAGQSIEIQLRISKNDWSSYTQTNDYSFDATDTTYVDWNKVTAYINGVLQWGIEP
ncbi:cellulase family glycosylhydrolase [Paenibacillus sp. SYP-B4298]|uniref:cellulase family glycosylhydrolase n=1 Tax=Paenibacillus sp. SYP-B4298 TaxID=2996034 RepID=UPI0022DE948B|nr:cellulase family glycosylhydrolase [Paenibacillus sp. SYP-B4298]